MREDFSLRMLDGDRLPLPRLALGGNLGSVFHGDVRPSCFFDFYKRLLGRGFFSLPGKLTDHLLSNRAPAFLIPFRPLFLKGGNEDNPFPLLSCFRLQLLLGRARAESRSFLLPARLLSSGWSAKLGVDFSQFGMGSLPHFGLKDRDTSLF